MKKFAIYCDITKEMPVIEDGINKSLGGMYEVTRVNKTWPDSLTGKNIDLALLHYSDLDRYSDEVRDNINNAKVKIVYSGETLGIAKPELKEYYVRHSPLASVGDVTKIEWEGLLRWVQDEGRSDNDLPLFLRPNVNMLLGLLILCQGFLAIKEKLISNVGEGVKKNIGCKEWWRAPFTGYEACLHNEVDLLSRDRDIVCCMELVGWFLPSELLEPKKPHAKYDDTSEFCELIKRVELILSKTLGARSVQSGKIVP